MEERFDKAMDNVLAMAARPNLKADDAQKLTQSAQNLAHAKATWVLNDKSEGKGKKPQGTGA